MKNKIDIEIYETENGKSPYLQWESKCKGMIAFILVKIMHYKNKIVTCAYLRNRNRQKHHLLIILSLVTIACYGNTSKNDQIEKNPGILLNPQDVPIFYDNHPLTGIKSFTITTSLPFEDAKIQKSIENSIEAGLKTEGNIIHLKDNDMRGLGAGTILLIQVGNTKTWDGNNLAVSRISLSVETFVVLSQTGTKTFPIVWNINTFLDGSVDSISEDNLVKAIQQLINDFLRNYRHANQDLIKKPIFYTYN